MEGGGKRKFKKLQSHRVKRKRNNRDVWREKKIKKRNESLEKICGWEGKAKWTPISVKRMSGCS